MAKDKPKAEAVEKKCPISRKGFLEGAKPLPITVDGQSRSPAEPKEFSTGSFGWFHSDKMTIIIDGIPVKVQMNITMTVIGSKEA